MVEHILDEPVYIIRAQDIAAIQGIEANIQASEKAGGVNLIRAKAQLSRIKSWQKKYPGKVRPSD